MGIQKLQIKGFRSLKNVTWEPGRLNVLIGPNGSGKSNLLRALALLQEGASGGLPEAVLKQGGIAPLLWDGSVTELAWILKTDPVEHGHDTTRDALTYDILLRQLGKTSAYRIEQELLANYYRMEMGERAQPFKFLERNPRHAVTFDPDERALAAHEGSVPDDQTLLSLVAGPFGNPIILAFRRYVASWRIYHDLPVDQEAAIRQAAVARIEKRVAADGRNLIPVLHTLYTGDREFKKSADSAMRAAFGKDFEELVFPPAADRRVQLGVRWVGTKTINVELLADSAARWRFNGTGCAEVAGCIDIDLGFSPVTNLLPIRRLRLAVGREKQVRAAWLGFPGFTLEPLEQIYRRLDDRTYRYESAGRKFVTELLVDDAGFVKHYPEFWQREASGGAPDGRRAGALPWWPGGVFAYSEGPLEADLVEVPDRRPDATLRHRLRVLYPEAPGRRLKQWLAGGRVRVNGVVVRRGDVPVGRDDRIELGRPAVAFPSPLRLVYEDEHLLVVDKPAGLLTIATETERTRTAYRLLQDWVGAQGDGRIFVVHRLDRETSGLLVFARSPAVKRALQAQFQARTPERVYVARVEGAVREQEGELTSHLVEDRALRVRPVRDGRRGKEAITRYRVLERYREATLIELVLVTGRRGQIRAQLAALGHPIVGDGAYGSRRDLLGRVCLHATRLGFVHPSGRRVVFESPPPPAFRRP